ncbi:MAG: hypothetical protein ACREF8_05495 [Chthoniobacterales bacterium]
MKAEPNHLDASLQTIGRAVADLKERLRHDYEQAYPELSEIIHLVLDEEEANAWKLSFPHLFLPDLVEAHVARLNLQPVDLTHDEVLAPNEFANSVPVSELALSY